MRTTSNFFICVIFSITLLINSQNPSLADKWKMANRLDTFEQTVKQYPFLIQNIKIKKLVDFIDLGICQFMQGDPGRYIIVDNQVYLYGGQKHYQRTQHYQKYLQRILKLFTVPDMYLLVHIYDALFPNLVKQSVIQRCRQIPMFLFNKNLSEYVTSTKFLLPDNYITIDIWPETIKEVKNVSKQYSWKDKIPKLFYRGACTGTFKFDHNRIPSPITREIVLKYCQRCGYAVLSYQHPDLIDAKITGQCGNDLPLMKYILQKYGQKNLYGNFLQFTQQSKYRYLLYADGASCSWRRAASFLFSSSVLFMPLSQNVQWFYRHLIPGQNFVMVNDDLSDLLDKMKQLEKNQTRALQIVKKGNQLAQNHLTFEAMANLTIQQITKYAQIQKLSLKQDQKKDIKRGIDAQLVLKFKVMKQQWEESNENINFQNIINNFPEIEKNLQISKLIEMESSCNQSFAKYLIVDNKIHCQGENCQNTVAKDTQNLIKKILKSHIIPDSYFLIRISQENLESSQECNKLPYFIFSKNRQLQQQNNKFLFPHPSFEKWQDQMNQFIKKSKKIDWNKKQNKVYFGGMMEQNYDLLLRQKRLGFAKLLANIINQKKEYFQAHIQKYFQVIKEAESNINENYKYLLLADQVNTKHRKSQILAMLSSMVVLLPKTKRVSWLDEIIIPGKHYIQIKEDLSNLKNTIQLLKENDEKIKQISQEAYLLASIQLEGSSIHRYATHILNSYSQVQKLTLTEGQKSQFKRGTPFKSIIIPQKQNQYFVQFVALIFGFIVLGYYVYSKIKQQTQVIELPREVQERRLFK